MGPSGRVQAATASARAARRYVRTAVGRSLRRHAAAPTLSGDDPPALGSRDFQPTWDDNVAGMAEAFSFKATADGPVDIVNVYLERHWDRRKFGNPGARLIAGIYADANGQPRRAARPGQPDDLQVRRLEHGADRGDRAREGQDVLHRHARPARRLRLPHQRHGHAARRRASRARRASPACSSPFKSDDRVFPKDSPISAYAAERYSVLVFTKGSTGNAPRASPRCARWPAPNEVTFDVTDDASKFTESNLAKYRAVVFLNNAGDVLNGDQQAAFENYFRGGGGFLGVHSAIEAEPDWHVHDRPARHARERPDRSARRRRSRSPTAGTSPARACPSTGRARTAGTTSPSNVRGFSHVLATVDENTYTGGTIGFDHPIAWCKDYQGGRSFYTGAGGTPESFGDRHVRRHLGGRARLGRRQGRHGLQRLRRHRARQLPADQDLGPAEHQRADRLRPAARRPHHPDRPRRPGPPARPGDGHVDGDREDPGLHRTARTASTARRSTTELRAEQVGLLLLLADQHGGHPASGKPYPAQTPTGNVPTAPQADPAFWDDWTGYFQLSRFKFVDGPNPTIDFATEQKIMKVQVDRGACCHVAGDIDFDKDNNLWLVTGDDTPADGGRRRTTSRRSTT